MTYLIDEYIHVYCNEYQIFLSIALKVLQRKMCKSCSCFDMMDMCGDLF